MLTPEDKDLLAKKGISEQQIIEQLACFEKGFPFLKLDAAASIDKGIMAPAESEMKECLEAWDTYKRGGGGGGGRGIHINRVKKQL